MKRLFISQPMRGKTDEEILLTRAKAVESARNHLGEEVEVIDSFFQNVPNTENKALWCLGESLKLLATADVAYFAHDWENYRGCKIENQCAIEYGITVIEDYRETEGFDDVNPKIENAFEKAYRETTGLSFGLAIEAAKMGKKIARAGWNGKNQYVELAYCISYKNNAAEVVNVNHCNIGNKAFAFVGTSGVQMGWLASQADMLADDWQIVE